MGFAYNLLSSSLPDSEITLVTHTSRGGQQTCCTQRLEGLCVLPVPSWSPVNAKSCPEQRAAAPVLPGQLLQDSACQVLLPRSMQSWLLPAGEGSLLILQQYFEAVA